MLFPGSIAYLPAWEEVAPSIQENWHASTPPPRGAFDHPVVLLSADVESGQALILIVTSFGGKRLHDKSKDVRAFHLPIHPCKPHPDSGRLLRLCDNLSMEKPSYVKIKPFYSIRILDIRPLRKPQSIVFMQSSYNMLVNESGCRAQLFSLHIPFRYSPPMFLQSGYGTIRGAVGYAAIEQTGGRPSARPVLYPTRQPCGYPRGLNIPTRRTSVLPQARQRGQDQHERFAVFRGLNIVGCFKFLGVVLFTLVLFAALYGLFGACAAAPLYFQALGKSLTSLLEKIRGEIGLHV